MQRAAAAKVDYAKEGYGPGWVRSGWLWVTLSKSGRESNGANIYIIVWCMYLQFQLSSIFSLVRVGSDNCK